MQLRRAAIVSPVRTAVGKFGGALAPLTVGALAAMVIESVVTRSGVDPARVDDVVLGHGYPSGEAPAIGRWAWLAAGLDERVPGYQVDRRCGSGLQAVIEAAMMVQTCAADVVLAGGADSMSNVEHYTATARTGVRQGDIVLHDRLNRARQMAQPVGRYGVIGGMIETAENVAARYGIGREASDAYALRSHQRAALAWEEGRMGHEVVPLAIPQRRGEPLVFERDEGVRGNSTLDMLAGLPPLESGVVTAGNASQQSDAAAACLVVAEDKLSELGLEPVAWLAGWSAAGCDPAMMGMGPVPAVERLLARSGVGWQDIGLIEVNEAFAAQVLAVVKAWGWANDDDRLEMLNVNGSGISLGHPIGATGARIMVTLVHEMARRNVRYGLETMCIGGGQGIAALFERL